MSRRRGGSTGVYEKYPAGLASSACRTEFAAESRATLDSREPGRGEQDDQGT